MYCGCLGGTLHGDDSWPQSSVGNLVADGRPEEGTDGKVIAVCTWQLLQYYYNYYRGTVN